MTHPAAHRWRTSTYSGSHDNCVEVRPATDQVAIRDTKNRANGIITVSSQAWSAFVHSVNAH